MIDTTTFPVVHCRRVYIDLETMRQDLENADFRVPCDAEVHGQNGVMPIWRHVLPFLLEKTQSDDVSGLVIGSNTKVPSYLVRFPESDTRRKIDCAQCFLGRWLSFPPVEYAIGDKVRFDLGAIRREIEECELRGVSCYWQGELWQVLLEDFDTCTHIEVLTNADRGSHMIVGREGTCGYEPYIAIEPRFLLPVRQIRQETLPTEKVRCLDA